MPRVTTGESDTLLPAVKPDHVIRMPLQSGVSSIWSLARAGATLVPGLALLVSSVWVLIALGEQYGKLAFWAAAIAATTGVLFLWFAGQHIWLAMLTRPSDVVLDGEGIRVDGGRFAGHYSWQQVIGSQCRVESCSVKRVTMGYILLKTASIIYMLSQKRGAVWIVERPDVLVDRLLLRLNDGTTIVAAEAERPIEKESLCALRDTIEASDVDEPRPAAGHRALAEDCQRTRQIALLVCPSCGAPCAPSETGVVQCRHCATRVPVPEDLRQRVEAQRRVSEGSRSTQDILRQLVGMPGAAGTLGFMSVAALYMLAAWLLPIGWLPVLWAYGRLDAVAVTALIVSPLAIILALFFLLRAHVTDRQALRLLTMQFGARSPERPGDPYGCRRCGAPLPERQGEVLVTCPFCNAENILSLDLRRDVQPVETQQTSLAEALSQRQKERMLWGVLTGVAAVLLAITGVGLAIALVLSA